MGNSFFNNTERILVGEILADLYAGSPVEAQRVLKWRTRINRIAPPFIGEHAKRVIEIGCGYGFTSNYLALLNPHAQVIGIDPDPSRIAVARETIGRRGNIAFLTAGECKELDFDCDVMILNQLLWRSEFAQSHRALLENASQWLVKDGELLVRALDPDTHWLRVMAENLRETVLAGEALTTLSADDLTEFCKTLGFRQTRFTLDGTYYRSGNTTQPEVPKRKPYASLPRKKQVASVTFAAREHDEALDFIFARPWDELKA